MSNPKECKYCKSYVNHREDGGPVGQHFNSASCRKARGIDPLKRRIRNNQQVRKLESYQIPIEDCDLWSSGRNLSIELVEDNTQFFMDRKKISIDQIRSTLHNLIERDVEEKFLHAQDNEKIRGFDLNSKHLRNMLGIGGAIDGVKAAWIALKNGSDPIRTLSLYSHRYFPGIGNNGIPEACDEISKIVKQWRGDDVNERIPR